MPKIQKYTIETTESIVKYSNGTIIEFIATLKGFYSGSRINLGLVRQELRPFLNNGYFQSVRQENAGRHATVTSEGHTDIAAVSRRYKQFLPLESPDPFLCQQRSIPFELLQHPRFYGRVRQCPRYQSIIFPHWGVGDTVAETSTCLVGYEIKSESVNFFSKGGRKGLFISRGFVEDTVIAICESGIDALSYAALRREAGMRVVSISGRLNPQQPALIQRAIEHLGEGAKVVAAFDNDAAGDVLTQQLAELVQKMQRGDVELIEDRPQARGADWNQILMEQAQPPRQIASLTMEFGE